MHVAVHIDADLHALPALEAPARVDGARGVAGNDSTGTRGWLRTHPKEGASHMHEAVAVQGPKVRPWHIVVACSSSGDGRSSSLHACLHAGRLARPSWSF